MNGNNIYQIINDLNYVSKFAEDYHVIIDRYRQYLKEEKACDEFLAGRKKFAIRGSILIVSGIITLILSIVFFIICLNESVWSFDIWPIFGVMFSCIGFGACFPLFGIGIGDFYKGVIKAPKKEKERISAIEAKEYYFRAIDYYKTSSELSMPRDIYVSYFPDCKARKEEIDYLIFVLKTGRAYTFREALTLLDKKKYEDEMKQLAEETMEYAKKAAAKPSSTIIYHN